MSLDHISSNYEQQYFVKYRPELKRFFKSEKTAIIFQQLEYWSSKYPKGFWKFFETCDKHPLYREGDSWEEELGFARPVFLRAFSRMGTHYKSKSAYVKESDPFQGKMYASYYDRKTNRTYFIRNHSCVKQFLKALWEGAKKLKKAIVKKVQNEGSCSNHNEDSFTRAGNNNSSHRTTSSQEDHSLSINPSPPDVPDPVPQDEKDRNMKVAQDMINIWNKITSNKQILRSDLKRNLPLALVNSFQGSLETWKAFCLKIASSRFLMGEAPNSRFKAYLAWLIKPDTVDAIHDNQYSLGDRHVDYGEPPKPFNPDEFQGSHAWKEICQQLCQSLGSATFRSWFMNVTFLSEDTPYPQVQCRTPFMKHRIETCYRSHLEEAIRQVLPHVQQIGFCL